MRWSYIRLVSHAQKDKILQNFVKLTLRLSPSNIIYFCSHKVLIRFILLVF